MADPVKGSKELIKLLGGLEKKVANKVVRQALREGAKTIAAEVKANAPVESGKVRASVKVRAGKRKKNTLSMQVEVTGGHQSDAGVDKSGGNVIGFIEFGRHGQAPNPFIRRSFAEKKETVRAQLLTSIASGVEALASEK